MAVLVGEKTGLAVCEGSRGKVAVAAAGSGVAVTRMAFAVSCAATVLAAMVRAAPGPCGDWALGRLQARAASRSARNARKSGGLLLISSLLGRSKVV
jgi:hypothetical protein